MLVQEHGRVVTEDEAEHEGGFVAVVAERPVGEAERGEGVGAGEWGRMC